MIGGMRFTPSREAASFSVASLCLDPRRVAARLDRGEPVDLLLLERGVDLEDRDRLLVLEDVAIHADDDALPGLDLGLVAVRRLGDLALEEVLLDRRDHAAKASMRSKYWPAPRARCS